MKRIIFATKNQGKMREIREILKELPIELLSMEEAGLSMEIVEDGTTFEENAAMKAAAVCSKTGCIALADDSGLEVDYLDKAPGVYSARYLGENTSYEIKNQKILSLLEGVPREKRTARFVSVIAAAFPDGRTLSVRGTVEGEIGFEAKGENGFGYDPIFFLSAFGKTTAELSLEEKNQISHRGKALSEIREKLLEVL